MKKSYGLLAMLVAVAGVGAPTEVFAAGSPGVDVQAAQSINQQETVSGTVVD